MMIYKNYTHFLCDIEHIILSYSLRIWYVAWITNFNLAPLCSFDTIYGGFQTIMGIEKWDGKRSDVKNTTKYIRLSSIDFISRVI